MSAPSGPHPHRVSPWYRSAMLWFALALPAATVIAGVFTYRIAASGSSDAEPDRVRRIAQVQIRDTAVDQRASALGLRGVLMLDRDGGQYALRLVPAPDLARLQLQLRHATSARDDRQLLLERHADGSWRGVLPALQQGAHALSVSPEGGDWRLVGLLAADATQVELHPLFGNGHD